MKEGKDVVISLFRFPAKSVFSFGWKDIYLGQGGRDLRS